MSQAGGKADTPNLTRLRQSALSVIACGPAAGPGHGLYSYYRALQGYVGIRRMSGTGGYIRSYRKNLTKNISSRVI
jgi:hypothetical protein